MSCQHAIKLGQFAGHNALSDLLGQPTLPYRQPIYRMCLDLGGAGAVQTDGWERRVLMAGTEAKTIEAPYQRRVGGAAAVVARSRALLAFGEPGTSKYRDSGGT